jgi:hypothetical protein
MVWCPYRYLAGVTGPGAVFTEPRLNLFSSFCARTIFLDKTAKGTHKSVITISLKEFFPINERHLIGYLKKWHGNYDKHVGTIVKTIPHNYS